MRSGGSLQRVNVVWICKKLTKELNRKYFVNVDLKAVCDYDKYWICDCGSWTTGDDNFHIPIQQGLRVVYKDGFYI